MASLIYPNKFQIRLGPVIYLDFETHTARISTTAYTDIMKYLALLPYWFFIMSCHENKSIQHSDKNNYATELIDNGFLQYADSSKLQGLKIQLINSLDIYDEENFRIAHIDAEELSEFSFDFFLPSLNRILARRNITLSAQKLNNNEKSFDALINGDTIQLYDQKDLDNNQYSDVAPRNFFRKLNTLLKTNGINEQFFLLYGGNDLHTMLLTDKQFSIITNYYNKNAKESPYVP